MLAFYTVWVLRVEVGRVLRISDDILWVWWLKTPEAYIIRFAEYPQDKEKVMCSSAVLMATRTNNQQLQKQE